MKAVILSAGLGTRMRPLTYYINKGLIPIHGRPILEHILCKLIRQGFREFILALSHLGEQVQNYFEEGERWGVHIEYSFSEEPLGTAGELANLRPKLKEEGSFLVHYGDILTDLDVEGMAQRHIQDEGRIATVGLVTHVPIHTGIATLSGETIIHFVEKPALEQACHAAVHLYDGRALSYMKKGEDLAHHTLPAMIAAGEKVCGFLDEKAYWNDVGRLSDLEEVDELELG